ncbi:MAG: helix-turn-helix domain-containing protein [Thermomicrobiales bacterium]
MSTEHDFTVSSGNVFADLLIPEPEEARAKAGLAHAISEIINHRGWTQRQAAEALGLDQPKVSALKRGRLTGFSIERLLCLLNALDQDVVISATPNADPQRRAHIAVAFDQSGETAVGEHHP